MTRTLYFRILFIFLGIVAISLSISFFITGRIFSERMNASTVDEMIAGGNDIIHSYEKIAPGDEEAVLNGAEALANYALRLYDAQGKLLYDSRPNAVHSDENAIRQVLSGERFVRQTSGKPDEMTVGLPFAMDDRPYALFISPMFEQRAGLFIRYLGLELLLVLLLSGFLVTIAAYYIVKPVRNLTSAVRKIAHGDFRVILNPRRKDEIGELTANVVIMARELETLEQSRRQFVSNVSHEIQSPLTSIKGFIQALKHKKMDEPRRQQLLAIVEEESERLSRLSSELLQLSFLEHEHTELNVQQVQLDEQIRKVVIALEPQWSSKQIEMELDLPEIALAADEDKLAQVWMNLLGNAIKFTGEGGKVRIEGKRNGQRLEIVVQDNGIGIPEEECKRIFEPFYKADKSRNRQIAGNGIGLSIARRIIDLHHGGIEVNSRQGNGTAFTVSLPLAQSDHL
ncbi:cell wall metabolism sensor histidine kinase WalK [Cohnella sp. REN36]|uniref:sensor histidine kinase n=1 Tax=Cohnella sp. REN36 TaxID=2887347 RepID=UPI001D153458|nr:HAMP domain-containing sensor histidine kinase [Cohnella sp. REN36]MCC3372727.1 HAMP domain-containing histidine kinase [Cohnella sp. REN36]